MWVYNILIYFSIFYSIAHSQFYYEEEFIIVCLQRVLHSYYDVKFVIDMLPCNIHYKHIASTFKLKQ